MKPYRITFLGGLRFESGAHQITRFRTQKTASLLAYLALHRGPQPREVLADLLWPDNTPAAARHSLRTALSSLRAQLESALQTETRAPLFEATRFAIGLHESAVSTDVADLEAAIRSAHRAASDEERAHFYRCARELYRGAFLPGFYDDWCLEAAERFDVAFDEAKQFLAQWHAASPLSIAPFHAQKIATGTNATKIVTLLVCDGALQSALKSQLKMSGAARSLIGKHSSIELHAWQFSSASAALTGAAWLHDGARRLALCTGEISAHNSDDLWNRAHVLLQSASAGQIVCCEATALFERERADIECLDLGVFHLPDAPPGAPPERIFQITQLCDEIRAFAPLNARPARGARVPRPLDEFFGRATELSDLRAHLRNNRLVTLIGAGGTGKTRLALQLAAKWEIERATPFYGAVFWVALADVQRSDGIAAALCDALGLERNGATAPFDAATATLNQAPATLLVLDNFEHLVEDGAVLIERLLEKAPGTRALITSRRLLNARGEIAYALNPLAAPNQNSLSFDDLKSQPSVQLFCDRARLARPDFALTAHNAETIAALCHHLEGIPLAIELAAARAGQMSVARILERLQARVVGATPGFERLDWMQNSARTAPARHRTLRAALSWSVDELPPALRQLLARLSVFRGGCTSQDAAQVCQAPGAEAQLEALRARSLLGRAYDGDEARYSMLETVRQYAHELAGKRGEIEDLQRRHADYFLGWAQNEAPIAVAPDAHARVKSWQRVRTQADNLRAALRWARQHEPLTALQLILACNDFSGAHLSRDELDIASALDEIAPHNIPPALLADALKLAAVQAAHHGDIAAQNEFALRHLDLIRETPEAAPATLGWAYFHWGAARHRSGHFTIARAALQQSLELFAQLEAPHCHQCHGWTLIEMGNTAFDAGDLATAAADFERCHRAFERSGDRDAQASARAQLADIYFHVGDHARAAQLWPQIAAIMSELGDEREHEWRCHQQGKHAVVMGELERGHALLLRALGAFRSDGQKLGMLRSLLALSQLWLARGNLARARRLLQAEAAERKSWGWPVDGCWEPLRQQLWQRARADEYEEALLTFAQIVESELQTGG